MASIGPIIATPSRFALACRIPPACCVGPELPGIPTDSATTPGFSADFSADIQPE
jgi:hypothetical protein